jgi:hypothetical protein
MGRQVLENMGNARNALQQVRGQITNAMTKVKTNTETMINNLKINANNLIQDARTELNGRLNEISNMRAAGLEAKNNMMREALYAYQEQVAGINQRNTQLEQKIFFAAQQAAEKLANLNANVEQEFDFTWNPNPYMQVTGQVPQSGLQDLSNYVGQINYPMGTSEEGALFPEEENELGLPATTQG